jgi:peptidase C39-like protein
LILIAIFGIGMFSVQSLLFPRTGQSFWITNMTVATPAAPSQAATKTAAAKTTASNQPVFTGMAGASKALVRINQMANDQYSSPAEYNKWALSACSTATMTEVMNAYGHKYHITDVLKVQSNLGQITPELGLVQSTGIDITVAKFGFQATHLTNPTLGQVIQIANQGRPVIVSFPPDRVPGGHILVVIGGSGSQVYLSDSSTLNQTMMSQVAFTSLWEGYAVVVTPNTK